MILERVNERNLADVRVLFEEYAASLGFSLDFQGFARELDELPGRYAPPTGCILLAPGAGCVALRKLDEGVCEMKRLYVRPAFHRRGVGRLLAESLIAEARALGYRTMKLDTVPSMQPAMRLYESLGFRDTTPYTPNPIEGARFLELSIPRALLAPASSV